MADKGWELLLQVGLAALSYAGAWAYQRAKKAGEEANEARESGPAQEPRKRRRKRRAAPPAEAERPTAAAPPLPVAEVLPVAATAPRRPLRAAMVLSETLRL